MITIAACVNLASAANLSYVLDWRYDATTERVITELAGTVNDPHTIDSVVSYLFQPSDELLPRNQVHVATRILCRTHRHRNRLLLRDRARRGEGPRARRASDTHLRAQRRCPRTSHRGTGLSRRFWRQNAAQRRRPSARSRGPHAPRPGRHRGAPPCPPASWLQRRHHRYGDSGTSGRRSRSPSRPSSPSEHEHCSADETPRASRGRHRGDRAPTSRQRRSARHNDSTSRPLSPQLASAAHASPCGLPHTAATGTAVSVGVVCFIVPRSRTVGRSRGVGERKGRAGWPRLLACP